MSARPGALDPVRLALVWSRLVSIVEESASVLRRTAFSQVIRESFDYTCVLLTRRGEALAQSSRYTLPGFIRAASSVTRCFNERFVHWEPGDIAVTNDPWIGAGHLHDLALVLPVFVGDRLVGFSGNIAHQADVGGRGYAADARSLYEEGLLIPPTKLFRAGEVDETLLDLIRANVRLPQVVVDDVHAQAAAARLAAARFGELLAELGLDDVNAVAAPILERSESAMRATIAELPNGRYYSELDLDGGGEPAVLRVVLKVEDDRIVIDYTGTDPQVARGINSSFNYTYGYSAYAIKAALEPALPNNDGAFRPIEVVAPEGTIVNCVRPAPVSARGLVGHALVPLVLRALVEPATTRAMAAAGAPAPRLSVFGVDGGGEPFHTLLLTSAGLGARCDADGASSKAFPTNTSLSSIEMTESTTPLRFERRALRPDSGGAGRQRGGLGQEIVLRNAGARPCTVATTVERVGREPEGLFGGRGGAANGIFDASGAVLPAQGRLELKPGGRVVVHTAGGGGWGDPAEREPELVRLDVENGYVGHEAAVTVYSASDIED